jgi:hypothetical protein
MKRHLTWLAAASLLACAAAVGPGCGGDDTTVSTPVDAGSDGGTDTSVPGPDTSTGDDTNTGDDTTVTDTSTGGDGAGDAQGDTSTNDSSSEAGDGGGLDAADAADTSLPTTCTTVGAACDNGGTQGLCNASLVCAACNVPGTTGQADDSTCGAAYGGSQLCIAGVCTPGDCRVQGDCSTNANGPICGVAAPNFCGKCTSDTQCPTNQICEVTATDGGVGSGACVAANVCGGGSDNLTCPLNPSDVCCGGVCSAGNCCNNAGNPCPIRTGNNNSTCNISLHICTTCAPASSTDVYVDPVNGNDTSGTGSQTLTDGGAATGCAFKTISRALQVVGSPAAALKIHVIGPATVSAGETFPIKVPANVTITTQGGAVTVNVPAQATGGAPTLGFELAAGASGLLGGTGATFTVSGQAKTASYGVLAFTGSTDGTFLEDVTISGFKNDGIVVAGSGILTIRQGVSSTGNLDGLNVIGTGLAAVTVPGGQRTTSFNSNAAHGIFVQQGGRIHLTGVPTNATSGTVEANTSTFGAGIRIIQTGNALLENTIDGVVAYSNALHGIHIFGGSHVKVRNSIVLGNQLNGVMVSTGSNNDKNITNIDLGATTATLSDGGVDYGYNTFQATLGNSQNVGSGVCLSILAGAGTLGAAGNTFSGPRDCANPDAGTLTSTPDICGADKDIGIGATFRVSDGGILDAASYDAGPGSFAGNNIDTANCTH